MTRSELPVAVQKTVADLTQGAKLRGLSEETEHGKKSYEAELIVSGHHRDVLIDESGTIVEVEEEVALESVPPSVREALTKLAGKGTIQKVESLKKHGKLVAYEAVLQTRGKRSEIQVGPGGEKLRNEE